MRKTILVFAAIFGLLIFGQSVLAADWQKTVVDSSDVVGQCLSLAVDSNNYVHISYYDQTNQALKYATNASGSWATEFVDDSSDNVGLHSSIAIDSNNKAHISYFDTANTNLKYATNEFGSWATSTIDSSGVTGLYTSIGVDSNNKVHISYYLSGGTGDLMYITNTSGAFVSTAVDTTGNVGLYTSLALDSNNGVHISYFDSSNDALKYATNSLGSWATASLVTLGAGGSENRSSIAIGSNNRAYISYYYGTDSDLRLITNASGSWVSAVIDADAEALFSSLKFDNYGNIHITYYDGAPNFDLKYATNDSGSWQTSVLDSSGVVGQYPSLAIDNLNRNHIGYWDFTNYDLDYIYTPGPSSANLDIDSGKSYTIDEGVDLGLSAQGSPTQMRMSESSDFSGADWETFSASKSMDFTSTGAKTVYAQFRDSWLAESETVSAEINYVKNPRFVTKDSSGYKQVLIGGKNIKYSGQDFDLMFKKYPAKLLAKKRYLQIKLYKKYPKTYVQAKRNLLKKYWLMTTNLNKYKAKKKFRLKLTFKFTAKEFKVLKRKVSKLKKKKLYVKNYVKKSKEWKDMKTTRKVKNNKLIVYLNSPLAKAKYYFAIGR